LYKGTGVMATLALLREAENCWPSRRKTKNLSVNSKLLP
jgi:hypothetical protein